MAATPPLWLLDDVPDFAPPRAIHPQQLAHPHIRVQVVAQPPASKDSGSGALDGRLSNSKCFRIDTSHCLDAEDAGVAIVYTLAENTTTATGSSVSEGDPSHRPKRPRTESSASESTTSGQSGESFKPTLDAPNTDNLFEYDPELPWIPALAVGDLPIWRFHSDLELHARIPENELAIQINKVRQMKHAPTPASASSPILEGEFNCWVCHRQHQWTPQPFYFETAVDGLPENLRLATMTSPWRP